LSEGTRGSCGSETDGLAILTGSQTSVLGDYAAAVLEDDQLMWLGYRYTNGNLVLDGQSGRSVTVASFLYDESNFNLTVSESIADDICIAINRFSQLVRRRCAETLKWSLCQSFYDIGKY